MAVGNFSAAGVVQPWTSAGSAPPRSPKERTLAARPPYARGLKSGPITQEILGQRTFRTPCGPPGPSPAPLTTH
jgi:hypothetical protein